jgi:hypothetical protein
MSPVSWPTSVMRLLGVDPDLIDFSYAAESYDAVVVIALAAIAAGSDDGVAVGAQINDVTRGGEKCTTFADCKALLEGGADIDYDGVSGPLEFIDAGEPSAGVDPDPRVRRDRHHPGGRLGPGLDLIRI